MTYLKIRGDDMSIQTAMSMVREMIGNRLILWYIDENDSFYFLISQNETYHMGDVCELLKVTKSNGSIEPVSVVDNDISVDGLGKLTYVDVEEM